MICFLFIIYLFGVFLAKILTGVIYFFIFFFVNCFCLIKFNKKLVFLNFLIIGFLNYKTFYHHNNLYILNKTQNLHSILGEIYEIDKNNMYISVFGLNNYPYTFTNNYNSILGNVLIKIKKNKNYNRGDIVTVKGKFLTIKEKFDQNNYYEYLTSKNITHILNENCIKKIKKIENSRSRINFLYLGLNIRDKLVQMLRNTNLSQISFEIISSLVYGQKNLTSKLKTKFQRLGIMHVFAISGLHLGILVLIFSFFLHRIFFFRKNKQYKNIILCIISWFFGFITGFSYSVLRSILMLNIFFYYRSRDFEYNVYTILVTTIFIFTFIFPSSIFTISLQLSYLAVLGILFFYPYLCSILQFRNVILSKIWKSICITISAQILTLPLILYKFNVFPTYSIFNNMIAVPLSFFIVLSTIFLYIFYYIPIMNFIIISIMNFVINLSMKCFDIIHNLPFSYFELDISIFELSCIYFIIILFVLFLRFKNFIILAILDLGIISLIIKSFY